MPVQSVEGRAFAGVPPVERGRVAGGLADRAQRHAQRVPAPPDRAQHEDAVQRVRNEDGGGRREPLLLDAPQVDRGPHVRLVPPKTTDPRVTHASLF